MTFRQAIDVCFKKFAVFEGRASRSEFWWFFLFLLMMDVVLSFMRLSYFFNIGFFDNLSEGMGLLAFSEAINSEYGSLFSLYLVHPLIALLDLIDLLLTVPALSVAARRLHDIGKSGWWQLLYVTVIGILLLLYWFVQPSTAGKNKYGGKSG